MKLLLLILVALSLLNQPVLSQNRSGVISNYIFPEFVSGVVLMKNGVKNNVSINYNTVTEEMVFVRGRVKLVIGKTESEFIDSIYMEGRKFIRLDNKFLEILFQSKTTDLYVQYKCKWESPEWEKSYNLSGRGGETKIQYEYIPASTSNIKLDPYVIYWINKHNSLHEATSLRQLVNVFDKSRKRFKQYIKEREVAFENVNQVKALVGYLDSIN